MAQAFVSTYKNNYRWNPQPRAPIFDPEAQGLKKLKPEGDIWLLDANEELERELRNIAKIEQAINKLYLKRMKTTYQVSYCKNLKPRKKHAILLALNQMKFNKPEETKIEESEPKEAEVFGNELLEYFKKVYGPKTMKITPPLSSSRNVFGYMRPSRLLTPLTMYQTQYGKVGFNILRANEKLFTS